jgi:superoxide dismutase, Cu-Zn family
MTRLLAATFATMTLASGAAFAQDQTATATFIDTDGQPVGQATLTGTGHGVLIRMEVSGLPADQWLGFHIHEGEVCEPEEAFETAGGHFNPDDADHGYLVEDGPHAGDMPNQYVPADGVLRADVFNSFVRLGGEGPDIRGRTLMIHAEPDDYESQPTGDAGARLACAVIE